MVQMAELVAVRTFIKLKILEAIPPTGSISLQDLSKATGAQESLLTIYHSNAQHGFHLTQVDRTNG